MEAAIQKANKKMMHVSSDKDALRLYEMREMAISDYTSGMAAALKQGKMEVAKNLFKMGMPIAEIANATELTTEELNNI